MWEIIDRAPLFYLLILAWILRSLGNYIAQRHRVVETAQYGIGITVFAVLGLRRLFFQPPLDALETLVIIAQCGAYGLVAYGIGSVVATAFVLLKEAREKRTERKRIERERQEIDHRNQREREQRETIARRRNQQAELSEEEREEQRLIREAREREVAEEQRQREEDARTRQTIRMQTELEALAVIEDDFRESVQTTIATYLEDDLPLEEFRNRQEIIRQHLKRSRKPPEPVGPKSLVEIEERFAKEISDIETLALTEVEKDSLRAYLAMEKQNAIQEYLKQ